MRPIDMSYSNIHTGIYGGYIIGPFPGRRGGQFLKRFLLRAESDPRVGSALKEIGRMSNMEEVSPTLPRAVAGMMRQFNGRPVTTAPEHKFYTWADNAHFQVYLDAHRSVGCRGRLLRSPHSPEAATIRYGHEA
jgi:hypothetical protein